MAKKKTRSLRCPVCRKLVLAGEEGFPFCSDRCRTIDLGKWASGKYVISTPADPEELEPHAALREPPRGSGIWNCSPKYWRICSSPSGGESCEVGFRTRSESWVARAGTMNQ